MINLVDQLLDQILTDPIHMVLSVTQVERDVIYSHHSDPDVALKSK